jgi:hypothetical protein
MPQGRVVHPRGGRGTQPSEGQHGRKQRGHGTQENGLTSGIGIETESLSADNGCLAGPGVCVKCVGGNL